MIVAFDVVGVGRSTEAMPAPRASFVPAMMRRRASPLTAAMIDAIGQAIAGREAMLPGVATIFGSAHGETGTLRELLHQLTDEGGVLSPIAFASSVHNTAAGVVSIATGNRGFTTSIAAGHDTVAACLLEAAGLMHTGAHDVIVVVGDLAEPIPLVPEAQRAAPLAAALHLRAPGTGPALARMSGLARRDAPADPAVATWGALGRNACVGALVLIDHIVAHHAGAVRLDGGPGSGWCVDLAPSEAG